MATRVHVTASAAPRARATAQLLAERFGSAPLAEADAVVSVGGDGQLLDSLHAVLALGRDEPPPVYGVHRGTTGFLVNDVDDAALAGLPDLLAAATPSRLCPLRAEPVAPDGARLPPRLAVNEVALRRTGQQSAGLSIEVDGVTRLPELRGDGVLVATPAGSPAYNLAAGGPVVPLSAGLLALTGVCPLRPRRWPGALLPRGARVRVDVLDPEKRPVALSCDQRDLVEVGAVEVAEAPEHPLVLLTDPGAALDERLLRAQFEA